MRSYAQDHRLEIGAAFTDIETAKRAGRTGFDAMVGYLRKNSQCRVLLMEKTDRLYRNFRDWVTIDEIRGLEVHFVKEATVISEDSRSSEKFIHGIKVLMAKNFIDNLSEETRKGMVEKASQGIWPSYAPIGCWSKLRSHNRGNVIQGRVYLGGALSGRDIEAVTKTISGLVKLLFPKADTPIADEDLEWVVRLALESRRRVKEQQKRCFKSEFRNTHFSYIVGTEGAEQFVSTPELHSDEAIETDPLPPGQVWASSMGTPESGPGLFRIEVTSGPGGGVRILNQPPQQAFRESVKVGEQNLYQRAKEVVGDRDPREHEFSIQMRAMDADKTGGGLGLPVLIALCGSLLGKNTRGGTIIVGSLNLGGSIDMIPNAVRIAELAIDKQAQTLLMPVSARRQLNDLPDDLWTRISIEFYKDGADAVFKALVE